MSVSAGLPRRALPILYLSLIITGMGQTVVFAIIPMLGRELGFHEVQINSLVSASALMYFLASPRWGRLSDRVGRKPMILVGLFGYVLGTLLFNGVSTLGLLGWMAGWALFAPMMVSRMLLAGVMAATQPSAMAYMSDSTTVEERTRGFSRLAAAMNVGTVVGPTMAQFATLGLLVPLYLHAGMASLAFVVVLLWLPESSTHERPRARRLSYFDVRYRHFLLIGLVTYTMFGAVQQTLGYYFQDTLGLPSEKSAGVHGMAMMLSSAAMLFSQLVLVQRVGWPPRTLLRIGLPLTALSFFGLAFAGAFWSLALSMMLFGLGMGLVAPGYSASATLTVSADEQGGISGLVSAAPGLGFVIGPLLGGAVYNLDPTFPYWLSGLVFLPLVASVWRLRPY